MSSAPEPRRGRHCLSLCALLTLLAACAPSSGPADTATDKAPPAAWVGLVGDRIAASGYVLSDRDGGLHADNPAQDLRADWREGELIITPFGRSSGAPNRGAVDGWQLRLRTAAWGRADALEPVAAVAPRLGPCRADGAVSVSGECLRRVELPRPGLTEWWENHDEGLEQGWTIDAPPAGDGPLLIELWVDGMEAAVTADGDAVRLTGGGGFLHYDGLAAWAADGRTLTAWLEPRDGGFAVAVDDADASWPITIDPILGSSLWTVEGTSYDEHMGHVVASAGDVDADGYSDVLVAAPTADLAQSNEGVVYLFAGSATGLSTTASWIGQGDIGNVEFGYSAASAGDVNGDGYSDVVVGAPQWSTNGSREGKAFVYLGSATGLATSASWAVAGTQASGYFGSAVASAGDINGDGYSDIAVGAPGWNGAGTGRGRATLYLGSASGISTSAA